MSVHRAVADVLLGMGIVAELICVLGVCWMRDAVDKLHFVAAGSTLGPILVGAAVILTGFASASATIQSVVALAAVAVLNPVLTHATGRLAWQREYAGRRRPEGTMGSSGRPRSAS